MFLQKLEIQGFKSFAGKTVFQFPARIIGVVGPNGSGKSNIVDAVRWILGERAAKNLRGDSLGNLIFAGTPKRSAASLARVALHMKKSELLPSDTEEVVLERRIDKSGNSEFFLNGAEVRLKDLAPMLARARLGARGMTIISQGESDVFVRSSPEERRLIMEEILGLKEFRIKKSEAERKLENTRINLEKVGAMMEEIAPHLKFLKKQKERWEKRLELEKELEEIARFHFGHEMRILDAKIKERETALAPLEKKKGEHEKNLNALKEKMREMESSKLSEKKGGDKEQIDALYRKQSELEREIARRETRIELERESAKKSGVNPEEVIQYASKLREELLEAERIDSLEEMKRKIQSWLHSLENIFKNKKEEVSKETISIEPLNIELASVREKIERVRKEEEARQAMQEGVTKEFRLFLQSMEGERDELLKIERRAQEEILEKERLLMKKEELERGWTALGRSKEDLENATKHISEKPLKEKEYAERRINLLRGELSAIGEIDAELLKEAGETEERYAFLEKEGGDLEKATNDLRLMTEDLEKRIHKEFAEAFKKINEAFNSYFGTMFEGGKAKLAINEAQGVEFEVNIPRKKIHNLDMLSGGEKSLVSLAALFAMIWVSPPPFLVLDEIDAALDDENARRFAELVTKFSDKTQFIIVTHNRITMERADILYGITMGEDGVSKVLSLKLEEAEKIAN